MAVRVWVLAAGYGFHAKALLDLEVMTDPELGLLNVREGIRHLKAASHHLDRAGMKQVALVLRNMARDIEPARIEPDKPQSGTVISMATGETLD